MSLVAHESLSHLPLPHSSAPRRWPPSHSLRRQTLLQNLLPQLPGGMGRARSAVLAQSGTVAAPAPCEASVTELCWRDHGECLFELTLSERRTVYFRDGTCLLERWHNQLHRFTPDADVVVALLRSFQWKEAR